MFSTDPNLKFIMFENVLINVTDISWSRVDSEAEELDPYKPWSMTVHFKGVSQFVRFDFKTHNEAKVAYHKLTQLVAEVCAGV